MNLSVKPDVWNPGQFTFRNIYQKFKKRAWNVLWKQNWLTFCIEDTFGEYVYSTQVP